MSEFDDISQQMEKLRDNLKTIAKDIEIGNVEISKEQINNLEKQLKLLKSQREEALAKGEIVGDEVKKTNDMLKLNQRLLKDVKDARTATGQMFIKISAAGNEFKKFLGDFSKQYALAEKLHKTLEELQEITIQEYQGWMAYLEIKQEKMKNG